MPHPTVHFGWPRPVVNASESTWGAETNQCWEQADAALKAVKDVADGALPRAGGELTGAVRYPSGGVPHGAARELGYRGAPVRPRDGAHVLGASDSGELQRKTASAATAWTIPTRANGAPPVGAVTPFRLADGAGPVTLVPASGVALGWAGAPGASGPRTLAAGAFGALVHEADDVGLVAGAGVS